MIVITMTNCPPKLRGDLSKWLFEINTGVYVGQLSARVRDALWERICENIKDGRATMVYNCNNEQHFEFRVHNTIWKIRDYDGIKLMMRPKKPEECEENMEKLPIGFSKASKRRMASRHKNSFYADNKDLVFLDIETTGLDFHSDKIIEIGVIVINENEIVLSWSTLIKIDEVLPKKISALTQITDEMLNTGMDLNSALKKLAEIIKGKTVVCYNKKFDITFLQNEFSKNGIENPIEKVIDVLMIARKKIENISNYKLRTIAEYYKIPCENQHRALVDCETLYKVFLKLNEI